MLVKAGIIKGETINVLPQKTPIVKEQPEEAAAAPAEDAPATDEATDAPAEEAAPAAEEAPAEEEKAAA